MSQATLRSRWFPRLFATLLVSCVGLTVYADWRRHYGPSLRAIELGAAGRELCSPGYVPAGFAGFLNALPGPRDALCSADTHAALFEIVNGTSRGVDGISFDGGTTVVSSDSGRSYEVLPPRSAGFFVPWGQSKRVLHVIANGLPHTLHTSADVVPIFTRNDQQPGRFWAVIAGGLVALSCLIVLLRVGAKGSSRLLHEPFGQLAIVALFIWRLSTVDDPQESLDLGFFLIALSGGAVLGATTKSTRIAMERGSDFGLAFAVLYVASHLLVRDVALLIPLFHRATLLEQAGLVGIVALVLPAIAVVTSWVIAKAAMGAAWLSCVIVARNEHLPG